MPLPIYLDVFKAGFLGNVGLAVSPDGLLRLRMFVEGEEAFLLSNQSFREGEYTLDPEKTHLFKLEIMEYILRERKGFSLPIDWRGYTDFQKAVLEQTLAIPYGETRSYGQVAAAIGRPRASRAVGQAEKRNQVPLVIPCHRVIGSDGSMTGYGGTENTDLKEKLLDFEKGIWHP